MAAGLECRHCFCCVDARGLAHERLIDLSGWKMRFWEGSARRFRCGTALDRDRRARLELEPHRIARCPMGSKVSGIRRKVDDDDVDKRGQVCKFEREREQEQEQELEEQRWCGCRVAVNRVRNKLHVRRTDITKGSGEIRFAGRDGAEP